MTAEKHIGLIVPTCNPGNLWQDWVESFHAQAFQPRYMLVVDSSSRDGTVSFAKGAGFKVEVISSQEFDHGGTRQRGCELLPRVEILVFTTHDALFAHPQALENLVACFSDPKVGAAFGRQLPRPGAGPIEAHARLFNYPSLSRVNSLANVPQQGIKAAFISNSFAAYRRTALDAIGGFPTRCIVSEDTFVAAKMLLAGWKIAYCAEAQVYHSHNYNWRLEFQRYFDIGVFHAREPWVRESFGGAEGEGWRFLRSELSYLAGKAPWRIPSALVRTVIKYVGFRAGLLEKRLPPRLKRRMSMQKAFWDQERRGIHHA